MKEGLEKHFGEEVVDIERQDLPGAEALETQPPVQETEQEKVDTPVNDFIDVGDVPDNTVEEPVDAQEGLVPETSESPLEMIAEEPDTVLKETPPVHGLPEGVEKLVEFMKDYPGQGIKEYLDLNRDFDTFDQSALLREYYTQTKPHLEKDDIDYLINKRINIDEEALEEDEVRDRKIALKEELSGAKGYLEGQKEKYYNELKAIGGSDGSAQAGIIKAKEEAAYKQFQDTTDEAFKGFEGFVFDLGEKRSAARYRINDVEKLKGNQQNLDQVFGSYFEDGDLKDALGFHKAVFAANNADNIASLFYEQGYAQAVEELQKGSKNLDFEGTKRAPSSDSKLKPGQARELTQQHGAHVGLNLKYNKGF